MDGLQDCSEFFCNLSSTYFLRDLLIYFRRNVKNNLYVGVTKLISGLMILHRHRYAYASCGLYSLLGNL